MKNLDYNPDDIIVALATAGVPAALAVIRISGEGAIEAGARLFSRKEALLNAPGMTLHYGFWQTLEGTRLDEVMVALYRKGKSYTGEESLEIFCHGGLPGIQEILESCYSAGMRQARAGEFTFRAFLNKKIDLTRAEAVQEIVNARTWEAQKMALQRLSGSIETVINRLKNQLKHRMAEVELQLDYPEDEEDAPPWDSSWIAELCRRIENLLASYRTGKLYQEGYSLALAGKTNAGKSSLFNLFLKEERSIVSELHGTTRDYLESWVNLAGFPVKMFDTAGLRNSEDQIEKEGIRRSRTLLKSSDMIIYLVDGCQGLEEEDRELIQSLKEQQKPLFLLWNKIDKTTEVQPVPQNFIPFSTWSGEGFGSLEQQITSVLEQQKNKTGKGDAVLDSRRQKRLLERCLEHLQAVERASGEGMPLDMLAVDLKEALDSLGEITGEVCTDDILETMFSTFCVGK